MANGRRVRKADRRAVVPPPQALVLVSRSAAPIEEFEDDVCAISDLGEALAEARRRTGHPMKLAPPMATWWSRRNGSTAWQLTLPLPTHVTPKAVHDAIAASRNARSARVQLQLLHPELLRHAHEHAPTLLREVRVGATSQHRAREVR